MTSLAVNIAKEVSRAPDSAKCQLNLFSPSSAKRQEVADYIAEKYKLVHEAQLNEFLPILVQMTRDEAPLAAFGLQPGHYRPLFLEQYLDKPIEQHVAQVVNHPIDRCNLIEIGNLVITSNSYGPLLLVILASSLARAGYEWMVFTATKQVSRLVRGMGFDPYYLIAADPERLGGAKANWGTYYNNNPGVMVGNTAKAVELISNNPRLSDVAEKYDDIIERFSLSLTDYRRLSKD